MQQELRDPEEFQIYKELHLWLWLIKGIASSYPAVYSLVTGGLKSKLKIPRPRSISQKSTPINEFKNNLHQQIKTLLHKALPQVNKYKKVTYWCSDETRLGLHTIKSAPADAFRRKARPESIYGNLSVFGCMEQYRALLEKVFFGSFRI